jgi:hypothetical protein
MQYKPQIYFLDEDAKSSAVSTDGTTLYAAFGNEGVYVINIADPKNPKKLRILDTTGNRPVLL